MSGAYLRGFSSCLASGKGTMLQEVRIVVGSSLVCGQREDAQCPTEEGLLCSSPADLLSGRQVPFHPHKLKSQK